MEVKGKLTIECERCGKSYDFLPEDVKFKSVNEDGYVWELKFDCLRCGNPISIHYEVHISSDGKVKDKKLDIKGAKVKEDSFEFTL